MIRISFDQIASPKEPGVYDCPGVGEIKVSEYWSAFIWDRHNGEVLLYCEEIQESTPAAKQYLIVSVVASVEHHNPFASFAPVLSRMGRRY